MAKKKGIKGTIRIDVGEKVLLDLDQLSDFQGNLKDLRDENYEKLKGLILDLGFSFAIHAWPSDGSYFILDGHQRVRTMKAMRLEGYDIPKLPVVLVEAESMNKAKRKVLAGTSQFGEITDEGLYEFMSDSNIPFDEVEANYRFSEIDMTDFNAKFYEEPNKTDKEEDEAPPEPPAIPTSRPGDLYILGRHRVLCGDSTLIDHVQKLMNGEMADMVWTDPPYNVNYEGGTGLKIMNDAMTDEAFYNFLHSVYTNMFMSTRAGGAIYVAHADSEGMNFRKAMKDGGWLLKQCLIWVKSSLVMGRQDYHWKHEPILYGWKPGASHDWFSDRKQTTVLEFDKPSRNGEHPTMKPVELIDYCLGNSCPPNGSVLDLFGGSGSTLIAAEAAGKSAFLMELDPRYVDVIVKRWERFTNKEAVLFREGEEAKREEA